MTGTLAVASSQLGAPVTLANPGPQASLAGRAASSVTLSGTDATSGQTLTYSATGLPAGLSISAAGVISGTPTADGTTTVTVTAKDGNGAYATQSFVWTVSPGTSTTPPPPPGSLQISAGGPATGTWVADEDFTGGTTTSTTAAISTTGVTNPAPQSVYQHNRYGNFTYAVPGYTPGAPYTIRLHFAETYWTTAGSRIFNVLINGTQVLTNFDILATAGGADKAVVEQFTEVAPTNGTFTIQFSTVKDNAQVNGIEILSG